MGCCVSSNEPRAFVAVNNHGNQPAPQPHRSGNRNASNPSQQQNQNGAGNNSANGGIARIQYLQNPNVGKYSGRLFQFYF